MVHARTGLIPTQTPSVEHDRLPAGVALPAPAVRVLPTPSAVTGKHVVIVGINYAPEPTGIAPYTTGMAEHLAASARSVTVLTGVPHYPQWQLPRAYRWRLRCREESRLPNDSGLLVHRLRHYVPSRMNALTRAAYEATFLANAATTRVRHAPDLVVAVTPSLGGALAGAALARRHGAPLVVVVQDLMAKAAAQSGIGGGGRVSALTARLERRTLQQADQVLVVSESFRASLHEYGVPDERIGLLPNWSHVRTASVTRAEARAALGWPAEPFTVVHTGNIGLKQDLGNVVEAARLMRADRGVRFVVVGDGSQRGAVRAQAGDLPNVAFVDPLDDAQYPLALAAADVLVVNERPGVTDMSLPSKLTSYLAAGRPVLAAVPDGGATWRELSRTGGAAVVVAPGEPTAFVTGVEVLRGDPLGCAEMAAAGRAYAERNLGRDAATARLDALLETCLVPA